MRKKMIAICIALSMVGVGPAMAQGTGSLNGIAQTADNQALSGVKVQVRNVDTGALQGATQSSATGAFSFTGLPSGNYVVEIVNADGNVIGVSSSMSVTAGAAISGMTVSASAAGAVAGAAAAGGLGAFFTGTGGILTLVGVGINANYIQNINSRSP